MAALTRFTRSEPCWHGPVRPASARLTSHERCQCCHLVRIRVDRQVRPEVGDRRRCRSRRPKAPCRGSVGLSRSALGANGFTGAAGQTLVVPTATGIVVAVGLGDPDALDANGLRVAAASFARAASKHADLATTLADVDGVDPKAAGQAVAEGVLLG